MRRHSQTKIYCGHGDFVTMQNLDYDVTHKPVSVLTMENVITIPARMWLTHSLTLSSLQVLKTLISLPLRKFVKKVAV